MKPSKRLRKVHQPIVSSESAAYTSEWCHFDDCPVCKLIKRSLFEGYEFSEEEWEEAFAEAEARN